MMRIAALFDRAPEGIAEGERTAYGPSGFRYIFRLFSSPDIRDPLPFRDFLDSIRGSDLFIVMCREDPHLIPRFDEIVSSCGTDVPLLVRSDDVEVTRGYRGLFGGSDLEYFELVKYLDRGIDLNLDVIPLIVSNLEHGTEHALPHPFRRRYDGVYHPDRPEGISLEDYLSRMEPRSITVGLMFSGLALKNGGAPHIDRLIRAFEEDGISVIPVFYSAVAFGTEGIPPADDVMRRYFTICGVPVIDALVLSSPFSLLVSSGGDPADPGSNIFRDVLGVPVFAMTGSSGRYMRYSDCIREGVRTDVRTQTVLPEMDGQILAFPVSERPGPSSPPSPVDEGIEGLSRLIRGWASLRRKPASEKRIAVLVYQTRPDRGHIANAAGLDTPASLLRLLERLRDEGYRVEGIPPSSDDLMRMMLSRPGNDAGELCEADLEGSGCPVLPSSEYAGFFSDLPEFDRSSMSEVWGDPPGDVFLTSGGIAVPGILFGNVFLGYQPMRGADRDIDIHDRDAPVHHQYLAFYRWIGEVFHADAVIHFGTHGSLEWLPGKSLGLSSECYPRMVMEGIPNICPYIVNDPGEGLQARRRSCAVLVSHLPPTMVESGSYGDLKVVDGLLQEHIANSSSPGYDDGALLAALRDVLVRSGMGADVGVSEDTGIESMRGLLPSVHAYLSDIEGALIKKGLHILGEAPAGEDLDDFIAMALPPSFKKDGDAYGAVKGLIPRLRSVGFSPDGCAEMAESAGFGEGAVREAVEMISRVIAPRILDAQREIDSIMDALNGRYVLPSPSGSVTGGNLNILPTGRNMYGLDPRRVPTMAAYSLGTEMADALTRRYLDDRGSFPESVAVVLWATDVIKNSGADVGMVLSLLGVRPEWDDEGAVAGLSLIPAEELGRPRADVTVRITGLFRDMFPELISLINSGVALASSSDDEGGNVIRRNIRDDVLSQMESSIPEDEARRNAMLRVFGPDDGSYGFGMDLDRWDDVGDLADSYVRHGGHGFDEDGRAVGCPDRFASRIAASDVLFKSMADREIDAVDTDDVFGFLGGMMAVKRSLGAEPVSYIGDASCPSGLRVRTVREELRRIFHSKVNNPRYVDGLMAHGYRGVLEISKMTDNVFGWSATADVVDEWMYGSIVGSYLDRDEVREWMAEYNPFAVMHMIERLFEASERGLWNADADVLERLKGYYEEAESSSEGMSDPSSPRAAPRSQQDVQEQRPSHHRHHDAHWEPRRSQDLRNAVRAFEQRRPDAGRCGE